MANWCAASRKRSDGLSHVDDRCIVDNQERVGTLFCDLCKRRLDLCRRLERRSVNGGTGLQPDCSEVICDVRPRPCIPLLLLLKVHRGGTPRGLGGRTKISRLLLMSADQARGRLYHWYGEQMAGALRREAACRS